MNPRPWFLGHQRQPHRTNTPRLSEKADCPCTHNGLRPKSELESARSLHSSLRRVALTVRGFLVQGYPNCQLSPVQTCPLSSSSPDPTLWRHYCIITQSGATSKKKIGMICSPRVERCRSPHWYQVERCVNEFTLSGRYVLGYGVSVYFYTNFCRRGGRYQDFHTFAGRRVFVAAFKCVFDRKRFCRPFRTYRAPSRWRDCRISKRIRDNVIRWNIRSGSPLETAWQFELSRVTRDSPDVMLLPNLFPPTRS